MNNREQIARVIAPESWQWFDGLDKDGQAYAVRIVQTGDAQPFGRSDRLNRALEAADRLIAAGLICDPEADDIRMNGR